jgi:hypothetical protein
MAFLWALGITVLLYLIFAAWANAQWTVYTRGRTRSEAELTRSLIEQGVTPETAAVFREALRSEIYDDVGLARATDEIEKLGIAEGDYDELIDTCCELSGVTWERVDAVLSRTPHQRPRSVLDWGRVFDQAKSETNAIAPG